MNFTESATNYTSIYWTGVLALFPVVGVLGNTLVCLAILTEKRLQNVTNYFLCSLAVADLLVSLFVMPMGLYVELNRGRWFLAVQLCNVYVTLDVVSCSASIIHMAVISFDRYWGISRPFRKRHNTPIEVTVRIVGVWLTTALLGSPITIMGTISPFEYIYFQETSVCAIKSKSFQIFGSAVAFLIPCIIMLVTYCRTVSILKEQAALCSSQPGTQYGSSGPTLRRCVSRRVVRRNYKGSGKSSVTHSCASPQPLVGESRTESIVSLDNDDNEIQSKCSCSTGDVNASLTFLVPLAIVPRSADQEERSPQALRQNFKKAMTLFQFNKRTKAQQMVATEQKATKVLGIVFACFICCWLPFFAVNLVAALCGECGKKIPRAAAVTFLWFGYISSTINPLIYTVFNKQFRKSFIQILTCGPRQKRSRSDPTSGASVAYKSSFASVKQQYACSNHQVPL